MHYLHLLLSPSTTLQEYLPPSLNYSILDNILPVSHSQVFPIFIYFINTSLSRVLSSGFQTSTNLNAASSLHQLYALAVVFSGLYHLNTIYWKLNRTKIYTKLKNNSFFKNKSNSRYNT